MGNQLALDLEAGRKARDRGVERARARVGDRWVSEAAKDFAAFLRAQGASTAESWRADYLARGLEPPTSHKCWGAVVLSAARAGLVVGTGRYVKARSVKTHGHPVQIWRAA